MSHSASSTISNRHVPGFRSKVRIDTPTTENSIAPVPGYPPSSRVSLPQILCEHHEDAARAMDVGQLVDVLVGGHAS